MPAIPRRGGIQTVPYNPRSKVVIAAHKMPPAMAMQSLTALMTMFFGVK